MGIRLPFPGIAAISVCIIAGCIAIPVPLPPRGDIYTSEQKIEDLVDNRASKAEVIEQLGDPLKYRKTNISYEACREPAGVGLLLVAAGGLGADFQEFRGNRKCFELVLDFDNSDRLLDFQEIPWEGRPDPTEEDLTRRELGKEGDIIAQSLWKKSRTYYTSLDEDIAQERNDAEGERQRRLASSELKARAEAGDQEAQYQLFVIEDRKPLKWLCRSADQGYVVAQLELAYMYRAGAYGVAQNYTRSYIWYRLAGAGKLREAVEECSKTLDGDSSFWNARICSQGQAYYIATETVRLRGYLSPLQLKKAEKLLDNWQQGQCEREMAK